MGRQGDECAMFVEGRKENTADEKDGGEKGERFDARARYNKETLGRGAGRKRGFEFVNLFLFPSSPLPPPRAALFPICSALCIFLRLYRGKREKGKKKHEKRRKTSVRPTFHTRAFASGREIRFIKPSPSTNIRTAVITRAGALHIYIYIMRWWFLMEAISTRLKKIGRF